MPAALGQPSLPQAEGLNPFAEDVCAGPYGVEENRSVPGLNADILGQLTATIDERQKSVGRAGGQPLLLLTAPRAGYGKTHLLGRLAAAAHGQVVLVPLAFRLEDEIGISAVAVRGLESMARAEMPRTDWCKLREACAGVCAVLVRRLIENGTLPCANPDQALRVLAGDPVEIFDPKGSARLIGDWVRRFEAQLRKPMTEQAMRRVPAIPAALEQWVDAMLNYALDGGMSHVAVLRALAADEKNEGPVTWLRLLGLWRPVVLLVDHLDAYYRNPEAGLRIASLLLDMSEMDGVHVVLSLNQDVWQATFGHHLPSAMEDRLTTGQMLLRGIHETEAAALLRLRLQHAFVSEDQAREFTAFVDVKRYFMGRPLGSVSARSFLRHAAKQWDFFQQTLSGTSSLPPPMSPRPVSDEPGVLPLMKDEVDENSLQKPAHSGDVMIFDSGTSAQMKRMAEGLAEPRPALPQQDEAPLLPPSPSAINGNGHGAHHFPKPPPPPAAPASTLSAPEDEETTPTSPGEVSSQFSPSSAGAFESLREMLGKLRQPSTTPPAAAGNGGHVVAERLAGVMKSTPPPPSAPAATPAVLPAPSVVKTPDQVEREVLLGRYEALRLQMAAEATSLPLDYTKLADLIRLAGRRFPLVRFSEHELPGMTGRFAMCWSLQGLEIVFGLANFADGSYWRTLAGFAAGRLTELSQDAQNAGVTAPRLKITTFKTEREQQSWDILQHSAAFPEALRPHVDPIHLDPQSVASLYAMQRIIKEAETGALQVTPTQVMSVLARELDFFWKRVTRAA
ncbi:hypothetical protein [Prosthecobacter vanneervenii]|uniref:Uncharacterized protein n=1 Tax=Prosthecobacter vanneervenii TaxID=48466 RepID=A0A7W7Y8T6_9BACT|nr:hypothetical protein [Prosthecobacter vanneervenii]MBB5031763.1 hypothetical protein [Prosthecobacter vanneervenii]